MDPFCSSFSEPFLVLPCLLKTRQSEVCTETCEHSGFKKWQNGVFCFFLSSFVDNSSHSVGFLAHCRALGCSPLAPGCLSLVVGGSSKSITACARLKPAFLPVHDFLCSYLNCTATLLHSHSVQLGPSTTVFSRFSILLP